MNRVLVVASRELRAFFLSPMAYVIGFLFVFFRGWETLALAKNFADSGQDLSTFPMLYAMGLCGQMMAVLAPPLLTMRLFAEEKKTGSLELLMTAPVRDWEVVMGKWAASLVFFMVLWAPTVLLLFLLQAPWLLGAELAAGPIFTVHLWILLAGGLFLAVGLFCSSLTQNQLVASISALVIINVLLWGPFIAARAGWVPASGIGRELFSQVYMLDHIQSSFGLGLVDTAHVWFYLSTTALFLFLTVRSVESRRWV